MSESTNQLEQQIEQLQQKNAELKADCEKLLSIQTALESMISETNKKQLYAEIESMELDQIFSSVTDAMWTIRDDGIVIRANDAMLALLGKPSEDVIGHSCGELVNYGLCHQASCPLEVTKSKTKKEYDIQLPADSDASEHFIMSVAPLTTIVGTTAILSQFKNITSRKLTEKKLEELNRTLTDMARIDGLTQIANRRYFDEMLDQEWRRVFRDGKQLSLIMGDIDYFKKFNDHYGHQAGDDCLVQVAKALKGAILRPADLAARYGGEEFVLLLPEVDPEGTQHVGARVIEAIAKLKIEHQASEISEIVTMSFGAATLTPSAQHSPADLIALADKALYQAKEQGRNRIVINQQQPSP